MTKTKNERITTLENEVAELKLIVHELRDKKSIEPSTTTVEDIIEFEGQQYRKVDREAQAGDVVILKGSAQSKYIANRTPYKAFIGRYGFLAIQESGSDHIKLYSDTFNRTPETVDVYELIKPKPLTPNQQRAAIIEKAKAFVKNIVGEYDTFNTTFGRYKDQCVKPTFHVNEKKRAITVLIYGAFGKQLIFKGITKCNSNDVFNEPIGKAIALGRALGLEVSEFEQAVQPNEVVPGHIIAWNEVSNEPHKVIKRNGDWFDFTNLFNNKDYNNFEYCEIEEFTTILNDTNAKYEVSSNE